MTSTQPATRPSIVIQALDVMQEAGWNFRDSRPQWQHGVYGGSATFDPFPAYPHQLDDVRSAVDHVTRCCPPTWRVDLIVADREEIGRSNGFSNVTDTGHYENDTWVQDDPIGLIMLSGKRVPPHPAVTRYLVAHEYGHNVEWMLNRARGTKGLHDEQLAREYAETRGLPEATMHHGSGGRWHDGIHEIMACDFRILVCDVETDFWPHPGVRRPEVVDGLDDWWTTAVALLDAARRAA